jgi:hypothetical protein
MIGPDHDLMRRARKMMTRALGETDLTSDVWPFDATDYYEPEMGGDLVRWFVSFADLISPERIAEIKRTTMAIEERLAEDCMNPPDRRVVNLDPGFIGLSKLVFLERGVYAEVTLQYTQGKWAAWPWTYPDYAGQTYHPFFMEVRRRLIEQLEAGIA